MKMGMLCNRHLHVHPLQKAQYKFLHLTSDALYTLNISNYGHNSSTFKCNYFFQVQNCGHDSYFDEQTLACVYAEHADPHHGAAPLPLHLG
jgi:hypothetical protein